MITPGIFVHFKGGRYTVIAGGVDSTNNWYPDELGSDDASHEATHQPVVIYMAHDHPERLCIRSEREWNEEVEWPDGEKRSRFVPAGRETLQRSNR